MPSPSPSPPSLARTASPLPPQPAVLPPSPPSSSTTPPRANAPPLPRKVGEIGYVVPPPGSDPPPPLSPNRNRAQPTSRTSANGPVPAHTSPRRDRLRTALHLSPHRLSRRLSTASSSRSPSFAKHKPRTLFGLHIATLAIFCIVLLALPGTIAAWALAAVHFQPPGPGDAASNSASAGAGAGAGGTGMGNANLRRADVTANASAPAVAPQIASPLSSASGMNATSGGYNGTSGGYNGTSGAFNSTSPSNGTGAGMTGMAGGSPNSTFPLGTANGTVPSPSSSSSSADSDSSSDSSGSAMLTSGLVFLHVAFAIGTILELLVLDRLLFRLIQQRRRWALLRRGMGGSMGMGEGVGGSGVLHLTRSNISRLGGTSHPSLPAPGGGEDDGAPSFFLRFAAPWNRPPLPSYAATLGVRERGTGDVEDVDILAPAPPEYGNVRGSVLLLAAVAGAAGARALGRTGSGRSTRSTRSASASASGSRSGSRTGRQSPEGEQAQLSRDAEMARRLEEALGGLGGEEGEERAGMPAVPPAAARA